MRTIVHRRRSPLPPLLAGVLFAIAPAAARAQTPDGMHPPPVPQVVTSARGEVQAAPDEATIMFAVETRGATAAAAGAANARIQAAVLDTLRRMKLPSEDIGTFGYSVQPEYRYPERGGEPTVVGYVARNTIRVRVRRIDQAGPAIDAALRKGANRVAGLDFESSRFEELRREALAAAVRNARADAVAMAQAAGGSLGDLLEVTNQVYEPPRPLAMDMMMARGAAAPEAATPIVPGEQTVGVMVTTRWRFNAGPSR